MSEAEDPAVVMAQARLGRVLKDKWHLDRLIGMGGMAAVYEATHRNRSRVAVKMLHPALSLDGDVRQRFLREGYVGNSVDHDGVVKVLDDDIDEDGSAFLVLELLEGESLDTIWEREGRCLPAEQVLPFLVQILDVLSAAHAKGVVHRDIKPENIFVTQKHGVKVLDFGIARLREGADQNNAGLTRTGSTMGTPLFMAPEQARGRWEHVDERTDIWAVGATAYTLLSGHWVHEAETWNETLISAATRPAPSLATMAAAVSPELVQIIDRSLAFDKEDRWRNARAMQEALLALMGQHGSLGSALFPSQPHFPVQVSSPSAHTIAAPVPGQTTSFTSSTRAPDLSLDESVPPASRWRRLAWIGALLMLAFTGAFFALTGDAVSLFHPAPAASRSFSEPDPAAVGSAPPKASATVEAPVDSAPAPTASAPPTENDSAGVVAKDNPAAESKPPSEPAATPATKPIPAPKTSPTPTKPKPKPAPASYPHVKRHYR